MKRKLFDPTTDPTAITASSASSRPLRAWNEPDEKLSIELDVGQWWDVVIALRDAHAGHDDDDQDSRYNGEYETVSEIIEDALGINRED